MEHKKQSSTCLGRGRSGQECREEGAGPPLPSRRRCTWKSEDCEKFSSYLVGVKHVHLVDSWRRFFLQWRQWLILFVSDLPIQAVGFPGIEGSTVGEKISAIGGHWDVRLHHQGASLGIAIVVLLPLFVLLLHPRGPDVGHVVHCEGRQNSSAWVFTILIDIDCQANLFLAVSGLPVSFSLCYHSSFTNYFWNWILFTLAISSWRYVALSWRQLSSLKRRLNTKQICTIEKQSATPDDP